MKNLIILAAVVSLLSACSSSLTAVPATPTAPPPTAYQVTLSCQDCADAGMEINLWTNPDRSDVAGSVPHNTAVSVLDTVVVDGTRYYKVRYINTTGWVSELMVKK